MTNMNWKEIEEASSDITNNAKQTIELFDSVMPNYNWLTPVKKIDYIIWGMRD